MTDFVFFQVTWDNNSYADEGSIHRFVSEEEARKQFESYKNWEADHMVCYMTLCRVEFKDGEFSTSHHEDHYYRQDDD